jgi:hypothetical protein
MSTLRSIEKKLKKTPYVPSSDNPREELRRLVREHNALTKHAVAVNSMCADRTLKNNGKPIVLKSPVPLDARILYKSFTDGTKREAKKLERSMLRELRKMPVYTSFLRHVFGCGPVVSAYLLAYVDFTRCLKPSHLRRFCGMAVIDGRLERRSGQPKTQGGTGTFCAELRTRLFQFAASMAKNSAAKPKSGIGPRTSKYIEIWRNDIHSLLTSPRLVAGKIVPIRPGDATAVSAPGFARSRGWHKAIDVFLEDLYMVGRSIAGLEIWPAWYAAQRGHVHGGKVCVDAPELLTLEQVLEQVGHVGGTICAKNPLPAWEVLLADAEDDEQVDAVVDAGEADVAGDVAAEE